jgi:hypothetical protein
MGDGATTSVTRFVRKGRSGEVSSRDYDFSDISIRFNQEQGYAAVKETLARGGSGDGYRSGAGITFFAASRLVALRRRKQSSGSEQTGERTGKRHGRQVCSLCALGEFSKPIDRSCSIPTACPGGQ